MVLPLVDEDRPKCYMCHKGFRSLEELREHQRAEHNSTKTDPARTREPAPGDVTVF